MFETGIIAQSKYLLIKFLVVNAIYVQILYPFIKLY